MKRLGNFIQGKLETSFPSSCAVIPVKSPLTQDTLLVVPQTPETELQRAVSIAQAAFQSWREVPMPKRQRVMFEFQHLLKQHEEEVAKLIVAENGKTLHDARMDVFRGREVVESACSAGMLSMGETLEQLSHDGIDTLSIHQPLGVTLGICPSNYPAMVPLWMFPLALTSGNTMILKPSERTPSAAVYLAELAHQAGIPNGVLQVCHGSAPAVDYLCQAPEVKAVSFVGSDAVGAKVYQLASQHGKRVQSNLGAKCHALIMPDADKDLTIQRIISGAFASTGQRCMAITVAIFVGESSSWIQEIVERSGDLKTGSGLDPTTFYGPMTTSEAKARALEIIQEGIDDGAICLKDGRNIVVKDYPPGNFIGPTILSNVNTMNRAYIKEIFGPVLCCMTVDKFEEGLEIINNNKYGNGAVIFTNSGKAARKFQHEVDAGQVGINVPVPVPLPSFSFTGSKASMLGDLHFNAKEGVRFYTQPKTIISNWSSKGGAGW